MATSKTSRMSMHSWIGTDGLKRDEMNDNFTDVDSEFGSRGTNVNWFRTALDSDDTSCIQVAIDYARANGGTVMLPYKSGGYITSSTISAQTSSDQRPIKIVGIGAGKGSIFNLENAVRIVRKVGYTHTLFYSMGHGLNVYDIVFDGNDLMGDGILIERGFELKFSGVRVINTRGYGMNLLNLSNASGVSCHVNGCGYDDGIDANHKPAFRISGALIAGSSEGISNNVTFNDLHVERSRATAVAVAVGSGTYEGAEFIRFTEFHVEQTIDNTGMADYSSRPVVWIGNARGVTITEPHIYGGSGELLRIEKWHSVSNDRTSVKIIGGDVQGHSKNGALTSGTPNTLIRVKSGDYVLLDGVTIAHAKTTHLLIDDTAGQSVLYNNCFFNDAIGVTETITDNRTGTKKGLRTINTTWIENAWSLLNGRALFRLQTDGRPSVESPEGKPFDATAVRGIKLPTVQDGVAPVEPGTLYIEGSSGILRYKDGTSANRNITNVIFGTVAPSSPPTYSGMFYIDTVNKKFYGSVSNALISDWILLN